MRQYYQFILYLPVLILTGILLPALSTAQNTGNNDFEHKVPESEVVLNPGAGQSIFYDNSFPQYSLEQGMFVGRSYIGFSIILLQSDSNLYGSFFGGLVGRKSSDTFLGGAWVTGISVGQQFYLKDKLRTQEQNRVEFYLRTGPGLGWQEPAVSLDLIQYIISV